MKAYTLFSLLFCHFLWAQTLTLDKTPLAVYFSPQGGATNAIVDEINHATHDIGVQAYSFTSAPILNALIKASQRGVNVIIIADKSNEKGKTTPLDHIASQGIETYIDDIHAIAHNKIMIIDATKVITGSFNFSKAAEENNGENLLIITNKQLAKVYQENFLLHKNHSRLYSPNTQQPNHETRSSSQEHHPSFFSKIKSFLGI